MLFPWFPCNCHRVQKSDAGVGIGTLIGDRDYFARKQKTWFTLAQNRFMFFDRNEIHIQAFVHLINGKLMSGHSSSSTFHHFQEFIIFNYQHFTFWALEARISSFYQTELLELNQEKIREHPWKKWEKKFRRNLELKNFEISETLGVHFLNF